MADDDDNLLKAAVEGNLAVVKRYDDVPILMKRERDGRDNCSMGISP